ncbi:MAG: hypothetical protein A2V90_05605 [Gammaproteobacteria bacterium RBG_16_57_12]|nr:MAG: hypothetical protein A2V90_05605 [Gammaproteobacteria bacterium RBG_16_57_12]
MNRRNIPNIITIVRILLVGPVVMLLQHEYYLAALLLFAVAGASDAVDGYLAKRYGWNSRLGSILDPLADKLLLVSTYLMLGWLGQLPLWLVAAVLVRDIVIVLGAVGYYALIGRYDLAPTLISKFNTLVQIVLPLMVLVDQGVWTLPETWVNRMMDIVVATTVLSGVHYVWSWGRRAYVNRKT